MFSFKLLTRSIATAATLVTFILVLSFYGAFQCNGGIARPAISREVPFRPLPTADTAFRVAIFPDGAFAPGLVANGGLKNRIDSIYEKEQKLKVEFFVEEDPERALSLLGEEGGADLVWTTVPFLTRRYCRHRGINPAAVLIIANSRGEDAVFSRRPAKSVNELKGATVACVRGGNSQHLLLFLLRAAGVDASGLIWRYTSTDSDARSLLENGRVELGAFSTAGTPLPANVTLLASSSAAPKLLPIIFLSREETVLTDRDRLSRFISGWFRGLEEVRKDQAGTVTLLSKCFSMDISQSEELLRGIVLTGYRDNCSFFHIGGAEPISFDYLVDMHRSLAGVSTALIPPCEALKNTDILVLLSEAMKKSPPGFDAGHSSKETMSFETLSSPVTVKFLAAEYLIGQDSSRSLDRFSRLSLLFCGTRIILNGLADTPENTVYTHTWGMRFYSIKKHLADLGIPGESISIGGIQYAESLAGTGNHAVTCQLVK